MNRQLTPFQRVQAPAPGRGARRTAEEAEEAGGRSQSLHTLSILYLVRKIDEAVIECGAISSVCSDCDT